jgi:hypothetical protein
LNLDKIATYQDFKEKIDINGASSNWSFLGEDKGKDKVISCLIEVMKEHRDKGKLSILMNKSLIGVPIKEIYRLKKQEEVISLVYDKESTLFISNNFIIIGLLRYKYYISIFIMVILLYLILQQRKYKKRLNRSIPRDKIDDDKSNRVSVLQTEVQALTNKNIALARELKNYSAPLVKAEVKKSPILKHLKFGEKSEKTIIHHINNNDFINILHEFNVNEKELEKWSASLSKTKKIDSILSNINSVFRDITSNKEAKDDLLTKLSMAISDIYKVNGHKLSGNDIKKFLKKL